MMDLSVTAQVKAALMANPTTRPRLISVACEDGEVSLTGIVSTKAEQSAVLDAVARIPGVAVVRNSLVVTSGGIVESAMSHGQFRHGEERSWGGYGGGGYEGGTRGGPSPGGQSAPDGDDRREG